MVQPLTNEYVDVYLESAGKPLAALRSALKENEALHDLATRPLMLNILILTYQGRSMHELSKREGRLRAQVWDDYLQRMVARKGNRRRYPLSQTRSLLGWLARQMRDHNQTVFYLEHLQPDWLEEKQQRIYTRLAVRLPAILIGILMGMLVELFFFGINTVSQLLASLLYSLLGGFLGSLWRGPASHSTIDRRSLVG
jgi:hypothetical protein